MFGLRKHHHLWYLKFSCQVNVACVKIYTPSFGFIFSTGSCSYRKPSQKYVITAILYMIVLSHGYFVCSDEKVSSAETKPHYWRSVCTVSVVLLVRKLCGS